MPIELFSRAKNAWNAFINNKDPTESREYDTESVSYPIRPDRPRVSRGAERSIVNAVYNRIAMDCASVQIRHVKLDENDRYLETINSNMNECFATEANIDQTGRALIQDIVLSMFDEGCVAVVPIDTDDDPDETGSYNIGTMRTAKILSWKPNSIRVKAYNDRTGLYQEINVLKRNALIIENPLYAVVNEPNSTMQRLIRKLALLDSVDEQSGSGKLDLIIQLPYTVRSELRKQQADERKKAIEEQLSGSKYGIAYIDSTEHITQLNRAVENNLMGQIEYLTNMVYAQLGITAEVLNGTADEKTMLNYNNRTIEPILSAIVDEAKRKWLTKTARTQKQSIMFFKDPFKLVPVSALADIADKFTRNEIMTSNEMRQIIGMKKSDDPNADQLRNKNLNQSAEEIAPPPAAEEEEAEEEIDADAEIQNEYNNAVSELDDFDAQLDELEKQLKHEDSDPYALGVFMAEDEEDWLAHYANPYYDPVKAHEYYMRTRELKGRTSTAGLNEEGRLRAQAAKTQIQENRKKLDEADKQSMNTKLEGYKSTKKTGVEQSKSQMQAKVSQANERSKEKIASFKAKIDSIKAAHSEATKSRIKSLQSLIKGKGHSDEDKENIRKEIETIRTANNKKRDELSSEYKSYSNSTREETKSENANTKSEHTERTTALNETYKNDSSKARADHKEASAKFKDEADKEYQKQLEKIQNTAEYQKEKKSKKSGSGSGGKLFKYKNHPEMKQ